MTKSRAVSAYSESTTPSKQGAVCTTFVECTDSHRFKELVQKLTGSGVSEGEIFAVRMGTRNSSNGSGAAEFKSGGRLMRSGIEMGPQKSGFKLHQRRQLQRKLGMKMDFTPPGSDPFACSSSYCYSSTPIFSNQSTYLAEEEEEFSFQPSSFGLKREPELLPLFPLHSPTHPRST